jgi:hypothetical protein
MSKLIYQGNRSAGYAFIDALDITQKWVIDARLFTESRTDLQNRLSHAWYGEIAKVLDSDTAEGWKCYCKLHHGVPIMRRDDAEFKQVYDNAIKGLSYEKKLKIMKILPVTSLMNTKQLTEYLENVQMDFTFKGVKLDFPDEIGLYE